MISSRERPSSADDTEGCLRLFIETSSVFCDCAVCNDFSAFLAFPLAFVH